MVQDLDGQILGVLGRNTRGGTTIYDVSFSNGQSYSTFDPQLAQQAQGAAEAKASVSIRVETTQKAGSGGRVYTNTNIIGIAPQGQLPAAPPEIPMAGAQPISGSNIPMQSGSGGGGGPSPEDKARMSRLSAAATAFNYVATLLDGAGEEGVIAGLARARQLTEEINGYGMSGQWSSGGPTTPLEIAASVPGVQLGAQGISTSVDANAQSNVIPWGPPQQ